MRPKNSSLMVLIGGIAALINTITFTLLFPAFEGLDNASIILFYFVHSLVTIFAGYYLLKQKKEGTVLLFISVFLFLISFVIPFNNIGYGSIFISTILLSFVAIITGVYFFVPVFTSFFIFLVFFKFVPVLRGFIKNKYRIVEGSKLVETNNLEDNSQQIKVIK